MPDQPKAPLVAEEDDLQTRSDIEAYQERERIRRQRAAVIRAVKEDMQSRRRMPDVSEPTNYDLGEDGEIPVVIEPRDEDGVVKVSVDTTGDGEIDAVLCFDKKKKLRDIKDMHSSEVEEERLAAEREERERKAESERETGNALELLAGKKEGDGIIDGLLGGDKRDRRDYEDYDKADADSYAKMQPLSLLGGGEKPKRANAAVKAVDVTYAKRPRRGRRRRRNRYPRAILR